MRTPYPSFLVACALGVAASPNVARAQSARPLDAPAPPAADRAVESEPTRPLRIGVIGGVGFPTPLAIEAMIKWGDVIAVGAEYGVLPTLTIDNVQTSLWSLAGDLRVFPFRGGFFVGLRAGHQHVGADTTVSVASYGSASEALSLDSWFVNPRMGFLWTSRAGLTLGMDAGVQIPVSSDTTSSLPLALVPGAQSTANTLGSSPLPTVDLLRIGMLF